MTYPIQSRTVLFALKKKKIQKLIGILITSHASPVINEPFFNEFLLARIDALFPSSFQFFVHPKFRTEKNLGDHFAIASVFKLRKKKRFDSSNQGNARSNVSWSTWFEVSCEIGIFFHAYSNSGYKTPGELYDRGWGKKGEMNTTRVPMDFDRKYETDVTWREWAAKRIREGNYRCATGKWKRNTRCSSRWWREEWEKWNFAFSFSSSSFHF